MKKRRVISLFIVFALFICVLSGCSSQSDEPSSPVEESASQESSSMAPAESEPEDTTAAEQPSEDSPQQSQKAQPNPEPQPVSAYPIYDPPVSFTWLDIRNPDYEQGVITEGLAENEAYRQASELLGIEVVWDLRMDATTTYSLMIAGGDYPDCWGSKLSDYYSSFETALEEEVIIDLTDLVKQYMPNYSSVLAAEPGLESNSYTENGYRLSVMQISTGYTQFGGQIRGDIMDELSLQMPETFDDMYNVLTAMKSAYPDSQPLILSKDGSQNCSWLGGGLGVMTTLSWRPFMQLNLYQIDGEAKLGLLEPEYKEYIEMLAKWYSEGLIYQDFFTNEGMGPPQNEIANNTSFVWYGSVNELPLLNSILTTEGAYIVGMTDVTRNPGETIHTGDNTSDYVTTAGSYAISTSCKHPEYILQYFDYFYSDEGYMLANFGVEGETYTIKDGRPVYTDMVLNNDIYSYVSALFKYCIYEGPFKLDVNRYFASFSDTQKKAVELWETNRDEAWNIPSGVTQTTAESERASILINEIGTYCSEKVLGFIVGNIDIDAEWDTFIATVESLGTQEMIDITQATLDRYYDR